jgi:molybdopterin-containing oxidoreductase family membrane subunit
MMPYAAPIVREVADRAPSVDLDDREIVEAALAPLRRTPRGWWLLVGICSAGTVLWAVAVTYTVAVGIGTWGNNIPVAWAFAIINFVWWIGIGHAGTFISAFLLLLNQPWRAAVSRMAEAMTLIALGIAGTFPLLHLGRPWFFYWLVPYPATMSVWPNFKSALPWDVAAISSYLLVSAMFFYLGLMPDLAVARDGLSGRTRRRIYGVFALGWNGAGAQWRRLRGALKLVAAVAAALVVSVHSIVSLDFSIAQLAGWHSTLFPPYFVVGAIYSGFAMVLALAIPVRAAYGLQRVITLEHLDRLARLLLTIGLLLTYCYITELYTAAYTVDAREHATILGHWPFGPFGWLYWVMLTLNVLTPQLFWFRRCRHSPPVLFGAAIAILAGMWIERFVIVVASLAQGALPANWFTYSPTWVDWSILGGSLSIFGLCFLLFLRFLPAVGVGELRRNRFERVSEAQQ